MKIFAPAKINLCLDILKKMTDGYHEIRTVFHEINLKDEIELFESKQQDSLSIEKSKTPIDPNHLIKQKDNLAFKALQLVKSKFHITRFAKIHITKNIPISSGFGGGSSNAAAVLKALNKLWNLKLTNNELMELGAGLGMDVPFFIVGGTALGEHYGEKITPLKKIRGLKIDINVGKNPKSLPNMPPQKVSPVTPSKTASMYEKLDLKKCGQNQEKTKKLLKGIETENHQLIIENIHNDFETIIPVPKNHHLTGSGPGIFKTRLVL